MRFLFCVLLLIAGTASLATGGFSYTKDKTVLNPFSDKKIREAMNWAIDRNYIAQEIAGGLAIPRYTAVDDVSPDGARYAADLASIVTKYGYNLDKAKAVVDAEMPTLGATKDANGKWQFKGKPVVLIGIIRTEDSRKEMGIYFAQQLEKFNWNGQRPGLPSIVTLNTAREIVQSILEHVAAPSQGCQGS